MWGPSEDALGPGPDMAPAILGRKGIGSGNGALGLFEVTAALNEGRVAHLVYDPEVR